MVTYVISARRAPASAIATMEMTKAPPRNRFSCSSSHMIPKRSFNPESKSAPAQMLTTMMGTSGIHAGGASRVASAGRVSRASGERNGIATAAKATLHDIGGMAPRDANSSVRFR